MILPEGRIPKKKSSAKRALDLGDETVVQSVTEEAATSSVDDGQPTPMEGQTTLALPLISAGTVKLGFILRVREGFWGFNFMQPVY